MNGRIKVKLHSQSGETIAETLFALLISALALVMLAGAIGTAARIVTQSEDKMQEYYQEYNKLASPIDQGTSSKDSIIGFKNGENTVMLVNEKDAEGNIGIGVKYYINQVFASKPVVAYAKSN